jgi:hypothetical protein
MIVIAGDIAARAVDDHAGNAAEPVPDALAFAIRVRRALYLIGGGRGAEHEALRKGQSGGAGLEGPACFIDA